MKNEAGVSPVIGVILIVTITVILAAVIAAFVIGISMNSSTNNKTGYVPCSDYYKILDKYKTPSGFYVKAERGEDQGIGRTDEKLYESLEIGGYGEIRGDKIYPVNVSFVPEYRSGMRDSCWRNDP